MNGRSALHLRLNRSRQRGAIFITALGIIVILSGLVLVFAQDMRTEAIGSANRMAYIRADAVERGAEQWVLAQVEASPGDASTITETPAEAIQISSGSAGGSGGGYFWLLRPNPDNDQQYDFGITDESGKLNVNVATQQQLLMFPNMTQEAADAIVDWHDTAGAGGTDALYASLPDAYVAKHADFETVEELMLVDGVTPQMMYGNDRNRDGVVDDAERTAGAASGTGSMFSSGDSADRGLIHYLTAYSSEPDTRLNVDNTGNSTQFRTLLTSAGIDAARASTIVSTWLSQRPRRGYRTLATLNSVLRLRDPEIKVIADKVKFANRTAPLHRMNVGTASRDAMMTLGLDESDVDKLINSRDSADTSTIAWVFDALGTAKALNLVDIITAHSYQYSADIVATSADGRAFKRVRIVVDSSGVASGTPAKIVYRKDLTGLGWPLPSDVRQSLRAGKGVVTGYARTTGSGARLNF